ncbi:hypothetical protein JR316_0009468 [Psilocybe cubensis]|uniref:Uncharacterized protein n=4 Tax=Psilocybe cubensis TaxID=181762 RepID=A0ACB8GU99_PSICU|nr:hypothetical protein JR316_0009462 [Psilocybe cubensis]XP_047746625.1 hypothetical protein JR316_0009464 [Psilocybe cubensis]XP_047746627.1 hypothetical protein JR316_0009466 [Psilocybe cubensis]XP_047746629.1 hypothetical protein JR316_0009468 [Psilocybe cubensis]KAH9478998.1 hypothetical protein JR316_0009462 [Psilocybe cubensis]KAH9479000.1 hypothetical protein JR316_0009464 [Psilocybe cubensis]KAH9479002.1 hypothetical protein JR316_0009466 [Psilocybe cubensis]KAH9479004.1 hypothetica
MTQETAQPAPSQNTAEDAHPKPTQRSKTRLPPVRVVGGRKEKLTALIYNIRDHVQIRLQQTKRLALSLSPLLLNPSSLPIFTITLPIPILTNTNTSIGIPTIPNQNPDNISHIPLRLLSHPLLLNPPLTRAGPATPSPRTQLPIHTRHTPPFPIRQKRPDEVPHRRRHTVQQQPPHFLRPPQCRIRICIRGCTAGGG